VGLSSVLNTAVAIARTKVFAVFLGPFGIGVFAQLNVVLNLAGSFVSLGMTTGTVRYAAEYHVDGDAGAIRRLARTTLLFLAVFSCFVLVPCLVFRRALAGALLDDRSLARVLAIALFQIPFLVLATQILSVLQGLRRVRTVVLVNVSSALLGLAAAVPLAVFAGLKGAAVYLVCFGALQFAAAHVGLFRTRVGGERLSYFSQRFQPGVLRDLLPYGAATLAVTLLWMVTDLVIRTTLIRKLGMEQNGIYQVVAGLSLQYWNILQGFVWMYAYPRVCELKQDLERINAEINKILRFQALFLMPILAGFLVFRAWVIPLFYSGEFLQAADLVFFQTLGDLFKCLLWAIGLPLIALKRLRIWVLLNLGANAVHLLFFFLWLGPLKLTSVVAAFAGAQILFFLVNYLVMRREIGFRLRQGNIKLVAASTLLLLVLGAFPESGWHLWTLGPLLSLLWACWVFRKEELAELWRIARRKRGPEAEDQA